jgi:hypothetical protein
MKKVRCYLTAAVLTFALTAAVYAGQMDTTVAPPPDTAPGQMDTTPSADASGNATIETLAEIVLDIYQSVNP